MSITKIHKFANIFSVAAKKKYQDLITKEDCISAIMNCENRSAIGGIYAKVPAELKHDRDICTAAIYKNPWVIHHRDFPQDFDLVVLGVRKDFNTYDGLPTRNFTEPQRVMLLEEAIKGYYGKGGQNLVKDILDKKWITIQLFASYVKRMTDQTALSFIAIDAKLPEEIRSIAMDNLHKEVVNEPWEGIETARKVASRYLSLVSPRLKPSRPL